VGFSSVGRTYLGGIVAAGTTTFAIAHYHWHSTDPLRFLLYLLLTAIASGVKVRLPGITGTMSLSFVLVLFCVIQLSPGEVADVAVVSALVQCFWKATQRPRSIAVGYNIGLMILSTMAAYAAYHAWPPFTSLVVTMVSAGCAYYLVNTLSVAAAIAITEGKSFFLVWRDFYVWSLPFYLFGASLAAAMTFLTRFNWEIGLAVLPLIVITYRSYRVQLKQLEEEKRHAEEMAALHLRTIETLALAIEAKDPTTAEHLKRVQVYTNELSKVLRLPEDDAKALQAASILHDVGKIAVPDYIISKPGRLTPDEFQRMKIHPIVGAEIAERIDFPYPVAPIIRAHHEKWDGSGYPYGLQGKNIPIGARILSVVDCFDALASDRQYRKALPLEEAMAVVDREAGKSFDPEIVKLLGQRYLELETLASGQLALEGTKLSLDVSVRRGESPDAGFESAGSILAIGPVIAEDLEEYFGEESLNLRETLAVLGCRVTALVSCDAIAIYLLEGDFLQAKYASGVEAERLRSLRIGIGKGVAGWVAENHKAILNGNPAVEPGYRDGQHEPSQLGSVLAVPLQTESETLGALALYSTRVDGFTRETLDQVESFSRKVALAIEQAAESPSLSPHFSSITGLPNFRALLCCIDAEIARNGGGGSSFVVVHARVTGIAEIHKAFGRESADETLRAIARAFRQYGRPSDYLAQISEDEFAFVMPGLNLDTARGRIDALHCMVKEAGARMWASELVSLRVGASCFPTQGGSSQKLANAAHRAALANDGVCENAIAPRESMASADL
jgi:diguanylate cyclase (GGDEF)-like protein/putative nucleotidyltransferase with HDIG domain